MKNCNGAQYVLEDKNDMNEIQTAYNSHQRKVNSWTMKNQVHQVWNKMDENWKFS